MRVPAGFCALATMAAFTESNLERRGAILRVTGALQTGSSVSNSIARTAGLRHDCEIGSVFGGHGAIASVCQTPIFREERHQKQSTVMGEVYMLTDSGARTSDRHMQMWAISFGCIVLKAQCRFGAARRPALDRAGSLPCGVFVHCCDVAR